MWLYSVVEVCVILFVNVLYKFKLKEVNNCACFLCRVLDVSTCTISYFALARTCACIRVGVCAIL